MLGSTRRDFLRRSMLAVPGTIGFAALLSERVQAQNTNSGATELQLMIAGNWAGTGLPPAIDIQQVPVSAPPPDATNSPSRSAVLRSKQAPQPQQFRFEFGGGMNPNFYTWVQQSVAHQASRTYGVVLVGNPFALQFAYEWSGGSIFQIDLPSVDAAIKGPVYANATLRSETLTLAPSSKYAATHSQGLVGRPQLTEWTSDAFRLSCSALGTLVRAARVSSISCPAQARGGSFSFALATTPEQLTDTVRPFSASMLVGGQLTPGQPTNFTLELLDRTLKKRLGVVTLQNCVITHMDTAQAPGGRILLTTITVSYSDAATVFGIG